MLNQKEEIICAHCQLDIPKLNYHNMHPNPIIQDLFNANKVSNAYAFMKYNKDGIAQKVLYKLKYAENRKAGQVMGRMMAYGMKAFVLENKIDLIIPVPIHKSKRKLRGYNQTEVIAKSMNDILNLEVRTNLFGRNESKESQAKKSKLKRWSKIEKQYYLKEKSASLINKNVLILDDVVTTGATITVLIDLVDRLKPSNIYVACVATGK